MTQDARFEDGDERPIRLKALEADDLQVISALVQDSVMPASEMLWRPSQRRFAVLLNRFRWEDEARSTASPERVQSVLVIDDALAVKSQGVSRDKDVVLSLLSIAFEAGEDGTGRIELLLAGDGAIAIDVEALDVTLKDVTKPYVAPSGSVPNHPE